MGRGDGEPKGGGGGEPPANNARQRGGGGDTLGEKGRRNELTRPSHPVTENPQRQDRTNCVIVVLTTAP